MKLPFKASKMRGGIVGMPWLALSHNAGEVSWHQLMEESWDLFKIHDSDPKYKRLQVPLL